MECRLRGNFTLRVTKEQSTYFKSLAVSTKGCVDSLVCPSVTQPVTPVNIEKLTVMGQISLNRGVCIGIAAFSRDGKKCNLVFKPVC